MPESHNWPVEGCTWPVGLSHFCSRAVVVADSMDQIGLQVVLGRAANAKALQWGLGVEVCRELVSLRGWDSLPSQPSLCRDSEFRLQFWYDSPLLPLSELTHEDLQVSREVGRGHLAVYPGLHTGYPSFSWAAPGTCQDHIASPRLE
jgi:hypothetical protein